MLISKQMRCNGSEHKEVHTVVPLTEQTLKPLGQKDLGILIYNKLTFEQHLTERVKKAERIAGEKAELQFRKLTALQVCYLMISRTKNKDLISPLCQALLCLVIGCGRAAGSLKRDNNR